MNAASVKGRLFGTLTDTGPLYALVDEDGQAQNFARCDALLPLLDFPLVTTWPCLAEAMYLCGQSGGWRRQKRLWETVTRGLLRLHALSEIETLRMAALMETYADTPMDLADASLVAVAETMALTRIFSLDSDFYIYRLADGSALEVVPGPRR